MVRIFRITLHYAAKQPGTWCPKTTDWLYQTETSFLKQWAIKTGPKTRYNNSPWSVRLVAEEAINGEWIEINQWKSRI